jgi:hypothetical protein
LSSNELVREQRYVSRLYTQLDDMREYVHERLKAVLRNSGGSGQAQAERNAAYARYGERLAQPRLPPDAGTAEPARVLSAAARPGAARRPASARSARHPRRSRRRPSPAAPLAVFTGSCARPFAAAYGSATLTSRNAVCMACKPRLRPLAQAPLELG